MLDLIRSRLIVAQTQAAAAAEAAAAAAQTAANLIIAALAILATVRDLLGLTASPAARFIFQGCQLWLLRVLCGCFCGGRRGW